MSKSPPPSPPPPFFLTDLQFTQKIGQNQFGEVWKVKSTPLSETFTLKKITKSKIQKIQSQFTREINKWYKICHKSLIRIISHYEDNDFLYLLMEKTEGIPLSKKLQIEKRLEKSTAIDILTQVIDTIEYLHNLHPPVMYKHIKPDNILVDSDGNVKMTDFCWANAISEEDSGGLGSSTLEYLAPEMFGKPDFGISIDIWCIGILLYEVIIGKSPFKKNFSVGILSDIQKCNVFYPDDMEPVLKDLIGKILVKEPGKRISLVEIKNHQWFTKLTIKDVECDGITAKYLIREIKREQEENKKLSKKIRATATEIEFLSESCFKLEEKITGAQQISNILSDENDKTSKNLDILDHADDENTENPDDELSSLKSKIELHNRKLESLNLKYKNLSEIKEIKQKSIEFSDIHYNSLSSLLELLNERHKSILSPSLMMAKALVYTLPGSDVELFNLLCGPVGSHFIQSCESLLTKLHDTNDVTFLKERYICELSILYKKKQAELLKDYEEKNTELHHKARKNQAENYKILLNYAESIINKKIGELDLDKVEVDANDLKEKQERFGKLFESYKNTQNSIQLRKRQILKSKILKYRKNEELQTKISTLSNLTESMLQEKVSLDLFKVRRIC